MSGATARHSVIRALLVGGAAVIAATGLWHYGVTVRELQSGVLRR